MQIVKEIELQFVPAGHENPRCPGVVKKVLFQMDDLGDFSKVQMINWAVIEPRKSFVSHQHATMQEVFVIISGMGEIRVDDETEKVGAGDAVLIPIQAEHSMMNIGSEILIFLTIGLIQDRQ